MLLMFLIYKSMKKQTILAQNAFHLLFDFYYIRYNIFYEVECLTIYQSLQEDGDLTFDNQQPLFV